jgi:muramidase (phage lysozyme)
MAAKGISANERAWLDTIRLAEGTWHGGGAKGYGTMFGGGQFDWSKGHPDRVVRSGGYASAAAGAYQFMPDTWKGVTKQLGVDSRDFSPAAQDRAALQLIRNRGVDPTQSISRGGLAKLAPEWASLPTAAGKSYYNQPVKRADELTRFFQGRVGANPSGAGVSGSAPNPGNGAAAATGGGGAAAALSPAGLLTPLLTPATPAPMGLTPSPAGGLFPAAADNPLTRISKPSAGILSVLAQQAANLEGDLPMLASRRQQVQAGAQRMAGSPPRNFMQRLIAVTQLPGV